MHLPASWEIIEKKQFTCALLASHRQYQKSPAEKQKQINQPQMASPGLMENEKEQKEKKNNNLPLQH